MSEAIHIELTAEAEAILRHVTDMPQSMLADIAKGMGRANLQLVSRIQEERLTGQGPFPVEEHRLGVRSNRLRGSLNASEVVLADNRAESAIGSNVKYAAIHEFGGVIHHKASFGTARLRTDRQGNLLRQFGFPHLAVFARKGHKRVKSVAWSAGEHDTVMPERAPVRTEIENCLAWYGGTISQAIEDSWNAMAGGNG